MTPFAALADCSCPKRSGLERAAAGTTALVKKAATTAKTRRRFKRSLPVRPGVVGEGKSGV